MSVDIIRGALTGTGIELVASCSAADYDARAPEAFRSAGLMPKARGIVVAASAGPELFRQFRARMSEHPELWADSDPYDTFIATQLARADTALFAHSIPFRRFDAAFRAPVRLDFIALASLVGLGSPGPFALAIHPIHGPWWALRGAWLLQAEVDPPLPLAPPCAGCAAPCVGGLANAGSLAKATPEVRSRCVVGQGSRYDKDQIEYHYHWANSVARMRRGR